MTGRTWPTHGELPIDTARQPSNPAPRLHAVLASVGPGLFLSSERYCVNAYAIKILENLLSIMRRLDALASGAIAFCAATSTANKDGAK